MGEKKIQYSKVIPVVTFLIFITTLWFCITKDFSDVYDTTLYVTAITITCTCFTTSLVWYCKKAQAENVAKIQLQYSKDLTELQFDTYEKKVRLQKELGIIGAPDIHMDEEDIFSVDEQAMEAMNKGHNFLSEKMDESISEPTVESV